MIDYLFKRPKTRKGETMKHYLAKCIICKLLIDKGHKAQIEYNLGNIGTIDCLDLTSGMAYECESALNRVTAQKKLEIYSRNALVKDVIILDLKVLRHMDLTQWVDRIKERLEI